MPDSIQPLLDPMLNYQRGHELSLRTNLQEALIIWVSKMSLSRTHLKSQSRLSVANTVKPIAAIWRNSSRSTSDEVMAWSLMALSHYRNQWWVSFNGPIGNGPVNSPHKGPVTRKMSPFDDVIMRWSPGDGVGVIYGVINDYDNDHYYDDDNDCMLMMMMMMMVMTIMMIDV